MINERYLFRGKPQPWEYKNNMRQGVPQWTIGYVNINPSGEAVITDYQASETYSVDPATIGQCTGLKDAKGRLIFEGDILKFGVKRVKVEWVTVSGNYWAVDKDGYGESLWGLSDFANKADVQAEIIGNIHDNPELLKGEELKANDKI